MENIILFWSIYGSIAIAGVVIGFMQVKRIVRNGYVEIEDNIEE